MCITLGTVEQDTRHPLSCQRQALVVCRAFPMRSRLGRMMRVRKPHLYYGWIVVAIGFITMLLTMGIFFSSGVLFAAIIADLGWSRASASLPFSVALITYAGTAWLAGRLFDRYGPRRLFPVGALCLGIGLIISAQTQAAWQLCLSWGIVVAQGYNLSGFAPHLALAALWFSRRRGIATGIILSGASVGGVVIVPMAQHLVDTYGWRAAYTLLGIVAMACLVPLNAIWQYHKPADLGLYPDGATTPPTRGHSPAATSSAAPWTLRRAAVTRRFWLLFLLVCCLGWSSNVTSVHQIAHIISNGVPSLLAASIIGLLSLLRAASSTLGGGLSDRYGREAIFTFGTLLCCLGLILLAQLQPPAPIWLLYGYALTFGVGNGVFASAYAGATADLFFGPYLGTILGLLELGWGLGGFAGSWFGGYWYDRWGSYHGVFALTIGISILGCVAMWLAAPRRLKQDRYARPSDH
jgi:MFS transporter, OFA family, oxalate/formate antiporter